MSDFESKLTINHPLGRSRRETMTMCNIIKLQMTMFCCWIMSDNCYWIGVMFVERCF